LTILVCSGKGTKNSLLLVNVELGEEQVIMEFNVVEVVLNQPTTYDYWITLSYLWSRESLQFVTERGSTTIR
jgi:hypothetical protein